MTRDSIDNRMVDLLYGELDEASARDVRAELARDPTRQREYEMLVMTRQIVESLDDSAADPQPLSHAARADVLREARLTAARVREQKGRRRAAWMRPVVAVFAAILLIATLYVLVPALETTSESNGSERDTPRAGDPSITAHGATRQGDEPPVVEDSDPRPSTVGHRVGAMSGRSEMVGDARRNFVPPRMQNKRRDQTPSETDVANQDASPIIVQQQAQRPEENIYGTPDNEAVGSLNNEDFAQLPEAPQLPSKQKEQAQQAQQQDGPEPSQQQAQVENDDGFDISVRDSLDPQLEKRAPGEDDLQRLRSRSLGNISQGSMLTELPAVGNEASTRVDSNITNSADFGAEQQVGTLSALDRGTTLMRSGEHAAAIDAFNDALVQARAPEDQAQVRYLRATTHQAMGQHIQAITDLREVVERHPSSAYQRRAELALAESLIAVESHDAAKTHLDALASGDDQIAESAREQLEQLEALQGGGGLGNGRLPADRPSQKTRRRSKKKNASGSSSDSERLMEFDDDNNAIVR